MSKKSDLLVRVRYLNPLPNPPFPPKLLNVNTNISRLGEPAYLDQLAATTPLPMLVDSEMGMPLDLNAYDGAWDGKDQSLNPIPDSDRVHHPVDLTLLAPFNPPPTSNGDLKSVLSSNEVSWMRNSSYLTRRNNAKRKDAAEIREEAAVDASEAAQLLMIEKTFLDVTSQDVNQLQHPNPKKRHLKVVESYDVLPDNEAWPNNYILLRFPERPSAATAINPAAGASSPRLSKSILRPIVQDDQQMMEFYLPQEEDLSKLDEAYRRAVDEEPLEKIMQLNEENPNDPEIDHIFSNVYYDRIRTYEVVSTSAPKKEILVSFQEGEESDNEPATKKRKGVYYKEINFRTLLRKTRTKPHDEVDGQSDRWDKSRVGFRLPSQADIAHRDEAKSQVADPTWTNEELRRVHGGDNMAEGQGEAIDDEEVGVDEGAIEAERGAHDGSE
ncbi:RNA polymerase II-associated factor 1 [Cryptococcus neoformans]|nr:RNA polymerase II-associated factor 1 [Cryptococcus neoformans var. grubii]OXH50971.1 RNA polymerase II-associated factor 1 [Cryptococcus neoformans var. grubii]